MIAKPNIRLDFSRGCGIDFRSTWTENGRGDDGGVSALVHPAVVWRRYDELRRRDVERDRILETENKTETTKPLRPYVASGPKSRPPQY